MSTSEKPGIAPLDLNQPEPGCEPVEPFPAAARVQTFLSSEASHERLRLHYFRRAADGALVAKAWFGPGTQGPPGHAHGGSMASLLDEVMGGCVWMHGHPVLAAKLVTEFREKLPIGSWVIAEGWIESREGRKFTTRGRLRSREGKLFAEGEGLFIALTPEQLAQFQPAGGKSS